MSQIQVEEKKEIPTPTPTYIVYDPARRRARRRRRLDPELIAYEPRRRRRFTRLDPQRGGRNTTDAIVDGLGFGLLTHSIPAIPEGNVGGFSYRDLAAGIITAFYEKYYMRRGWSSAIIGAIAGISAGKIVSSLGGWRT